MPAKRLIKDDDALWQSYKRQSIQQAVIQLMCREGLKSVTMERVAQEVGIAKGTVYLHYRDKQELLEAVKESSLEPLVERIRETVESTASPDRKLESFARRYLTYFDEKRDLFRILLYEREVTRVYGSRYKTDRYRRLLEYTTSIMQEGMTAGIFRHTDPQHLAAMFIESNLALVNQRLMSDNPLPVEEDAQLISDLFLDGVRIKGRRRTTK